MAKETEVDKIRAAKWEELGHLLEGADDKTRDRFEIVTAERLIEMFAQQMRAGSAPYPPRAYEAARAIVDGRKVPEPRSALLSTALKFAGMAPHARRIATAISASMRHITYAEAAEYTAFLLDEDSDGNAAYMAEIDQQLSTIRSLMPA